MSNGDEKTRNILGDTALEDKKENLKTNSQSNFIATQQNHFSKRSSKYNFTCNICLRKFVDELSGKIHCQHFHYKIMLPEQKIAYVCYDCDLSSRYFLSLVKLRAHRKREHCKTQFKCRYCDAPLCITPVEYCKHRYKYHLQFICSICLLIFEGRIKFTAHVKDHHPEITLDEAHLNKRRYICRICNCPFAKKYLFKQHIDSEHMGVAFPCPECGKILKTEGSLRLHRKMHISKCDYKTCEICGKQFYRIDLFNSHIRYCNKNSISEEARKELTCPYCKLMFTRPGGTRRHIEARHKITEDYSCPECSRKFRSRVYMLRHCRAVHPGLKVEKLKRLNINLEAINNLIENEEDIYEGGKDKKIEEVLENNYKKEVKEECSEIIECYAELLKS